jgi:hypothetical protein
MKNNRREFVIRSISNHLPRNMPKQEDREEGTQHEEEHNRKVDQNDQWRGEPEIEAR